MSERMTAISGPGITGLEEYGRYSRAHMLARFREHYRAQLEEAQTALALPDDALVVTTYLGPIVQRQRQVVGR